MIDFEKFAAYSKPGPRYTSYPTAVEFHNNFSSKEYIENLQLSDEKYRFLYMRICHFVDLRVIFAAVMSSIQAKRIKKHAI